MGKKNIPSPSDFSKPKAGSYLKKEAGDSNKSNAKKRAKTFSKPRATTPKENLNPDKPHRRSKRSFQEEEARMIHEKYDSISKGTGVEKNEANQIEKSTEQMPLNKFIAHCGICSRRDAVDLIKSGKVKVNNETQKEPGFKVSELDKVMYDDKAITPQRDLVYYLLNKPKDYITTTDDPEGRKTVLDLMTAAPENRIYPVGRLDRNTTGLLLLTNDGDLAQKLAHPKNKIKKVYQVVLDKPLETKDFEAIVQGITLEDGLAPVDEIAYVNPKDKRELGVEIHIGRNRIVRRIFEHLGYHVKGLDRVIYAGLTKKNLQRGKWRELLAKEIIFLKHFKQK